MKRIIKTYETCSDELLEQLAEKFPNGIKDRHISPLTTIKGEKIRVVELQTDEALYLIKFSDKLEQAIDEIELDFEIDEEGLEIGIDDDVDANIVDSEALPEGEMDEEMEADDEDF